MENSVANYPYHSTPFYAWKHAYKISGKYNENNVVIELTKRFIWSFGLVFVSMRRITDKILSTWYHQLMKHKCKLRENSHFEYLGIW